MAPTIDQRFALVARQHPDRPCAVFGTWTMSYAEVLRAATSIARALTDLIGDEGGASEPVVALLLHRAPPVLPAMLGSWLAGAAFLPVDLDAGEQRLRFMLADASAVAIVTHEHLRRPQSRLGLPIVAVEDHLPGAAPPLTAAAPERRAAADSRLAYVIYTSGSTGRPKGVAVEHRSLAAYAGSIATLVDRGEPASWASISSFAADLSYTALFPPLLSGGSVHMVPRSLVTEPAGLAAYLREHQVDAIKLTPSYLSAALSAGAAVLPRDTVVLGGEPLHWSLVDRIRELCPTVRVFNHYGPTETTVGACLYRCAPDAARPSGTVPIGTALPHVSVSVLDEAGRSVLPGRVGELHIGGAGVARGYVGPGGASGDRFRPAPGASAPDSRTYATGDQVRLLPGGLLQFLGRTDAQVKVSGYRVEPAEIEAALEEHSGVVACAVVPRETDGHVTRLVAYVAPAAARVPTAELQRHLGRRLPPHMIPSQFEWLEELPRTSSGKVDRAALRRRLLDTGPGAGQEQPDGDLLSALVATWRQVLGRPSLGPDDDFLLAGGGSLDAVRLAGEVRARFPVELRIASIYLHPTPRELARFIAGAAG